MMHTKQKAIRVQSLKWSLLESMASNQLVLICGRMQLGGEMGNKKYCNVLFCLFGFF